MWVRSLFTLSAADVTCEFVGAFERELCLPREDIAITDLVMLHVSAVRQAASHPRTRFVSLVVRSEAPGVPTKQARLPLALRGGRINSLALIPKSIPNDTPVPNQGELVDWMVNKELAFATGGLSTRTPFVDPSVFPAPGGTQLV